MKIAASLLLYSWILFGVHYITTPTPPTTPTTITEKTTQPSPLSLDFEEAVVEID